MLVNACPHSRCYVHSLSGRKNCPICNHPTDESKLVRCRPFEDLIGQLRVRCKHGLEEESTPPEAQVVQQDDTGQDAAHLCSWRGRVCELQGHLALCGYKPVDCPNTAAGCKESLLRKDAARHASETCAFRPSPCAHCGALFSARALQEHEGSFPEEEIECPNAGCGEKVARRSMGEHRGVCGREEVTCPCPGCEERVARAEVEEHVEASGAVHLRSAWRRVAEMEEKVAGLHAALERSARALTCVFTWSTDSA